MQTKHKTLLVLSMLGALGTAPLVSAAPDAEQARPMGSVRAQPRAPGRSTAGRSPSSTVNA